MGCDRLPACHDIDRIGIVCASSLRPAVAGQCLAIDAVDNGARPGGGNVSETAFSASP